MTTLPIAVRVYPDLKGTQPRRDQAPEIDAMLVFDCETRRTVRRPSPSAVTASWWKGVAWKRASSAPTI